MIRAYVKKNMSTAQGTRSLSIELRCERGEMVGLFGASGSGKTTVLRMIAGLSTPESGRIEVNGQVWFDSKRRINVPAYKRSSGFVFQEYSLFPHLSVRDNMRFGLKCRSQADSVDRWLAKLDLTHLQHQLPGCLSGGQKQRVALGRALVAEPAILLLDEPFAALDVDLRQQLQQEIGRVQRQTGITTILVSHDSEEVSAMCRRTVVLREGSIAWQGDSRAFFTRQRLSSKNKLYGRIEAIEPDGVMIIVSLSAANHRFKVLVTAEEVAGLRVGSDVLLSSKAFNPLLVNPVAMGDCLSSSHEKSHTQMNCVTLC